MPPATRNSAVGSKVQKPTPKESIFKKFNLIDVLSDNGRSSSLQHVNISASDQEQRDDTPMRSPVTDAPPQPSPALQGDKGVIVAKEKEYCLVRFPHSLEHMAYEDAVSRRYEDKVDSENNGFNSKSHLTKLDNLQKKYRDSFASKVQSVLTSDKYGKSGWRTSELTISNCEDDENGTYRISRTNALRMLKQPTLENREEKGRGEPSRGPSAPPESRHNNVQDLTEQDNDRNGEVIMLSPVTDASLQPSPAVPGVRGAILRKENSNCLVYFSNKLVHMDYQKAKDELHHDNVKENTAKLHCKDDEADLIALKTKEEDVSAFYSKIDSVLTSQRYHPNRRSTAIKLKGDERVYIMAPTKAQSVLTKAVFDEHNNKPHASDPSQGDATHTSPSIIRSVETPSPLPKSGEDTKMGNSQKCSGKYLIVGKDLKTPSQPLERGTPCMVRDANNIHTIMLWSEIQDAQGKRTAVFQDTGYSHNGMHPGADRDFLSDVKRKGESSKIKMKDAILWKYQSKMNNTVWYKTVFSEHQDPAEMEKLYRTRNKVGDDSGGSIRSSGSAFVKAGQSKAALDKYLKNKYPVLWEEYTNSLSKGSARDRSATPEAESSLSSSEFNGLKTTVEELTISVNGLREWIQLLIKDRK
ncbi:hypothetical protein AA0119_g13382 [Alternaria tenuissima]|uniref:Uncharacterized protein n=2 Tax=Alternaria alternata complex TaxID=187734 RepID=A0A4Q4MND9_ALTAL|nr:hypothetical protein AA0115_g13020 [Alternaria tenuissima]RYN56070.1 hypothetical protein AA0117_g13285 [Alternaria alternata]RYN21338.1 hypothetical protein AA0114_g12949 [Alternaria tenuissima]RYN82595.1 hypothetical protein AA0119_g13382 [Alternaria tenuissima]RYO00465.1 hypothetical protein AA0121_g13402 [Alternaria tenuissima]